MGKKDSTWLYEKQAMAKQFIAIMGYRTPIRDVPDKISAAAYSDSSAIYLKKDNLLTKGLESHKARACRFGLFVHEMGHQHFTDFDYLKTVCEELEPWEVPAFRMIFSIVEDPAIENLLPSIVGGYLLKSMKYAIKRNYDLAKPIQESTTAFEQCLNAMVQFGDMGPIKGRFTFPDAKKYFYRVMPLMQDIMDNGHPRERIELSMKVFEEMRPLWEEMAKEGYDAMGEAEADAMAELMAGLGKGLSSGIGSGEELDPEELADTADLSKGAMRNTTFKKLEDMDEEEKTLYEEKEEAETETLVKGGKEEEEAGMTYATAVGSDETVEVYSDAPIDLSTTADYDPMEYEMEVMGTDFLDRLIQSELELDAVSPKSGSATPKDVPDFPEVSTKYAARNYKCKNVFMSVSNPTEAKFAYNKIVKKNFGHIMTVYKKLKAMFAEEAEETEYRSSGKLSVDRTVSTTVSAKVFTKTVDPKDKSNMAVIIAIDESGSMYGSRIERAKEAAINFVEIFGKLGIPTYVLGYTADTEGADAVHHHYTSWNNHPDDRVKLTSIHAQANNFDGYSIRYASKVLGMRPETHKVMIVISDGQPACNAYNWSTGYSDTKDAIREARSGGQVVLGVAIGSDLDVLQEMYGRDFIAITTGEDLFTGIMKKFTDMVKKW